MADGEEKYSESFAKLDFDEESSEKSPPPKNEDEELEEAVEFELEEPGEFEEKSSSEHEEEEETETALDAQVEFMDDEESDMDALDESNSNPSPLQNKPSPTSPENPAITVEYQEPPTEFVDDDSQTARMAEHFEDNEASRQGGSRTPSPENFLEQPDDIMRQ